MTESIADGVIDEKQENFSEAVCAICDNGGELICCEGKCLRAFHATVKSGSGSACDSLGFSDEEIEDIETFVCENCQYNQHQCYVCGKLGSSDKSANAEVFQCGTRTCGYFYHPSCVANALQIKYKDEAKDIEAKIAAGKPFICPLHICSVCKEVEQEGKTDLLMQFAVCRRCPMAYHRKCLPGTIAFEADDGEEILPRAWEELIPNKILIYCTEHVIDDELETPLRDHLKFPHSGLEKENQALESISDVKIVPSKKVHPSEGFKKRTLSKQFQCAATKQLDNSSSVRSSGPYYLRQPKVSSSSKQLHKSSSVSVRRFSEPYSLRDRKLVSKYTMASLLDLSELKMKASSLENNSYQDSEAAKLKDMENSGSEKQAKRSKDVADGKECLEDRKSSGLEKRAKSSKEVAAKRKASSLENDSYKDSEAAKLKDMENSGSEKQAKRSKDVVDSKECPEDMESSGLEKRAKSSKEVAVNNDSPATKLENQESSGSEKRSKSSKDISVNKDSVDTKLENKERSAGSEKQRTTGKEVADKHPASAQEYLSNGHVELPSNSMNSCTSGIHDSTSSSRFPFKSLGFAPGPFRPFSENSSAGWLNE